MPLITICLFYNYVFKYLFIPTDYKLLKIISFLFYVCTPPHPDPQDPAQGSEYALNKYILSFIWKMMVLVYRQVNQDVLAVGWGCLNDY